MCPSEPAKVTQLRLLTRIYFAMICQMAAPLIGLRPVARALIMSRLSLATMITCLGAYLVGSMALGGALGLWFGGFVGGTLSRVRSWTRVRRAVLGMTAGGLLPGSLYVCLVFVCLKAPDIIGQYYGVIIAAVVFGAAGGIVIAERM
jgi:hypothetical protein